MARSSRLLTVRIAALWLCAAVWQAHCQILKPYADLSGYEPYYSVGGSFSWPSGDTQVFTEGSQITVAWDTTYDTVNLYDVWCHNISANAVIDGVAQSQVQLATGLGKDSFTWDIKCTPDCSAPFTFHIVNAQGNTTELTDGGFWSIFFWVSPTSTSSSSTPGPTSTSTSASQAALTTTSQHASSTADSASSNNGSSSDSTAIGAGVGVGVGVPLVLALGAFFWWRHRRNKKAGNRGPASADGNNSTQWYNVNPAYQYNQQPQMIHEASGHEVQELYGGYGAQKPAEVPSYRDPHELPTSEGR